MCLSKVIESSQQRHQANQILSGQCYLAANQCSCNCTGLTSGEHMVSQMSQAQRFPELCSTDIPSVTLIQP